MKLLACFSIFLVVLSQHSLLIECGEKINSPDLDTNTEPILDKSLSDELQKALNEIPVEKLPSQFKEGSDE